MVTYNSLYSVIKNSSESLHLHVPRPFSFRLASGPSNLASPPQPCEPEFALCAPEKYSIFFNQENLHASIVYLDGDLPAAASRFFSSASDRANSARAIRSCSSSIIWSQWWPCAMRVRNTIFSRETRTSSCPHLSQFLLPVPLDLLTPGLRIRGLALEKTVARHFLFYVQGLDRM